MPGPAGGSRGGGFGGGSRGGGGSFGGGGGGYGRGPRRPYGGFFFFPWRPYYGIGGGFLSLFLLPIVILVFALIFLATSIIALISAIINGGVVIYNEADFQEYADRQYKALYGEYAEAYEDNILIVFATTEELDGYYTIAYVGDNISYDVDYKFGGGNDFGYAMDTYIYTDGAGYKSSLSSDLADVIYSMRDSLYAPYFDVEKNAEHAPSQIINRDGDLDFNAETVGTALDSFTLKTGIPISIVIEDEEDIFGKRIPVSYIVFGVISLGICAFCVFWIFKSARAKREARREAENRRNGTDYNDPEYWN